MRSRIFISYKRRNKEKVFPIKEQIERITGENCWIDLDGIESDAQFVDVIIKAIDQCDVFLFMYSNLHGNISDLNKDWTIRELQYAEQKNKKIVFLNLDQSPLSDWFLFMFGQKQQVDISSEKAFGRLLNDIKGWLQPEKIVNNDEIAILNDKTPSPINQNQVLNNNEFRFSTILITSNQDCEVEIDGHYVVRINKNEYIPVKLSYGKHNLRCTSLEYELFKEMDYEVTNIDKSDVIRIDFIVTMQDIIFSRKRETKEKGLDLNKKAEEDEKNEVKFDDVSFEISKEGDLDIYVSIATSKPVKPYVAVYYKKQGDKEYQNADGIKFENSISPDDLPDSLKQFRTKSNIGKGCLKKSVLKLKNNENNVYNIKLVLKNLYPHKIYDEYNTEITIYYNWKLLGKDEVRLIPM